MKNEKEKQQEYLLSSTGPIVLIGDEIQDREVEHLFRAYLEEKQRKKPAKTRLER